MLRDLLYVIDMRQEDSPAAVLLQTEIVKDFLLVLAVLGSLLELVPFVADDLSTGKASDWYLDSCSPPG